VDAAAAAGSDTGVSNMVVLAVLEAASTVMLW
jgi:hypothetical protein